MKKVKYAVYEVMMAIGHEFKYHTATFYKHSATIKYILKDNGGYSIGRTKKEYVLDIQVDSIPHVDNLRTKQIFKLLVF